MPSAKQPMTFLECPYHEDSEPHILLDIKNKSELVCEELDDPQMIDEKHYGPLYEESATVHGNSKGKCVILVQVLLINLTISVDDAVIHGAMPSVQMGMQPQQPQMLFQQLGMQLQQPGMQLQQPQIQLQQPGMQFQQPRMQPQQPGIQLQQPGMQPLQLGMTSSAAFYQYSGNYQPQYVQVSIQFMKKGSWKRRIWSDTDTKILKYSFVLLQQLFFIPNIDSTAAFSVKPGS